MWYQSFKKIFGSLVFCFFLFWQASGWATIAGTLIPFYIYPSQSAIQPLLDAKSAHPHIPMRIILNPASGPGTTQDPTYVSAISTLKQAGIEVAGYVYTNYNARPLAEVENEISLWYSLYNPDGIFLDSMGALASYYQSLNTYAKNLGAKFVIGNPGMNVDTSYANLVDTVVIANENTLPDLSNYTNWKNAGLPATKVGMFLYGISPFPDENYMRQLKSFVGWIYITDIGGMDPWESLPTYFNQLMNALDTTGVGLMFPFYIYPTQAAIQPLISAKQQYPNVPMRVILNPNSGPGSSKNTDYVNAVAQLKQAGISVLGYVHTSYGARNKNTVKNEISRWWNWYKPDGIFLDEMGTNGNYYTDLTNYAKGLGIQYVVGNPGTDIGVTSGQWVDTVTIFENPSLPDLNDYQNWYNTYPPSKIAFLSYQIPTLPSAFISDASQYFGWLFVTDDGADGNPWDEYPTYFLNLMALLSSL